MAQPDWKSRIRTAFPRMPRITRLVLELMRRQRDAYRGGTRPYHTRVWCDDEYEERRRRVLSTPLP